MNLASLIVQLVAELAPLAEKLLTGALSHEDAKKALADSLAKAGAALASLPVELAANDAAADAALTQK